MSEQKQKGSEVTGRAKTSIGAVAGAPERAPMRSRISETLRSGRVVFFVLCASLIGCCFYTISVTHSVFRSIPIFLIWCVEYFFLSSDIENQSFAYCFFFLTLNIMMLVFCSFYLWIYFSIFSFYQ